MEIFILDFESFFSDDYTLKKLSTEAYIRDFRFEAHGVAVKRLSTNQSIWVPKPALKAFFNAYRSLLNRSAIICHHSQFDGLILSHHYDIRPAFWYCTLCMARLELGNHLSASLDKVREFFGLPFKRTPYHIFKGQHWEDLSPHDQQQIGEGAIDEVESIGQISQGFLLGNAQKRVFPFPREELYLIDQTIRMFTEPVLIGDKKLLMNIWEEEEANKARRLELLDVNDDDLQSPGRFTKLLEDAGVEIEYKTGKNDNLIPAFAKTDDFMQDLLEDEDDYVRGLVEARLALKSTALQTRAETIFNMAVRGALCVYLRYCGALTTRWAGGDRTNYQNLKRRHRIRQHVQAPEGYAIYVPDQSQIECRLLNYLAKQEDVVERFRRKEDPYIFIASKFYRRPITKEDEAERGMGKQLELSCGYMTGPVRFQATAKAGTYGPKVFLPMDECVRAVKLYRDDHPQVKKYWQEGGLVLEILAAGGQYDWGPMHVENHRIWLPNGTWLNYDTLEWHPGDEVWERGWRLKTRHGWQRMYGAKLVEHTTQALGRVLAGQAMARIGRAGIRVTGMSHDELWPIITEDQYRQGACEFMLDEMRRVPDWLPGCPLDAEGKLGKRYPK